VETKRNNTKAVLSEINVKVGIAVFNNQITDELVSIFVRKNTKKEWSKND
jgi:hypothetical protein